MDTKRFFLKSVRFVVLLLLVGGGAWFFPPRTGSAADDSQTAGSETLYTCGMHPQVIRNQPGNCPICGMKLTPIRKEAATTAPAPRTIQYYKSTMMPGEVRQTPGKDSMGMDMVPVYEERGVASNAITIDPVTTQNMNIRTGTVTKGPLRRTIRTVAVIDYDETSLADVTTRFKGWIIKLYVNATGQQVHKGNPLFEIYSPELYSAQSDYLLAIEYSSSGGANAQAMKAGATARLMNFDISDDQIAELERTKQVKKTLTIQAPRDGIVMEKNVVEGQMADENMRLYRIADLSLVWVQAQIYEEDLPFLHLGQDAMVTLTYLPDRKFQGRVTYIYPMVDEKTRTVKVRMEFHNPGYFLKPGMFATVELRAELEPFALLVPDSAILRSGERNTVFVALEGGRFEPRAVTLGPRSEDNMYQVLSGLSEGEHVVTSGQFMLDSESQLREAIQKMTAAGATATKDGKRKEAEETPPVSKETATAYVCPMPEHVSIEYQHPGKCPVCGMTLVPATADLLAGIRSESPVAYYTCPMPEHADVHMDMPGKCPKCGMTLIPVFQKPAGAAVTNAPESHERMHYP
jgi:membrane fusion protein, copper/silver efflux system